MDIVNGTNIYVDKWLHWNSLSMIDNDFPETNPLPGGGDLEGDFVGVDWGEGLGFAGLLLLDEARTLGTDGGEQVGGIAVGGILGDEAALDGGLEEGGAELCGGHGRRS